MLDVHLECRALTCTKKHLNGVCDWQAAEAWQRERQLHCSPVDTFFGGLLQSMVCCAVCRRISHSFEYFLDLSLPLPTRPLKLNLKVYKCIYNICEARVCL